MIFFRILGLTFLCICFLNSNSKAQVGGISNSDMHFRQGDFQAALNSLNVYIELYPKDAQAYLKRARIHELLGQKAEKEKDLRYANYLNPLSFMYISDFKRTNLYDKKKFDYDTNSTDGKFKKSPITNNYYKLYIKDQLSLHSQDSLLAEAIYFLSQSDLTNTELALSNITVTENIVGIYYDLKGLLELKNNNLESAINYFTKSIDAKPNFPLVYHNRAIAYKLLGDYENSKSDLMKAISLNENISVFFFTLAKLSERLDNPNEAISYYKDAIDKNPNYLEARTNLSILQKTLGNYDEAIEELFEVSEMMGDDSNSNFIKGGIFLTFGEYEKAIDEFNEYLRDNEDDCDALFNRGLAKILSGQKVDGCEDVSLSVEIKSNSKRIEILNSFCPDN